MTAKTVQTSLLTSHQKEQTLQDFPILAVYDMNDRLQRQIPVLFPVFSEEHKLRVEHKLRTKALQLASFK